MKKLALAVLIIALFAVGYIYRGYFMPIRDIDRLGPKEIVQTYYGRLAAHDFINANRCLSEDYLRERSKPNSVAQTPLWLGDIEISKGIDTKASGYLSDNYAERLFDVEYNATFLQAGGSVDGHQLDFVYVAKKTKDSPWRIIGIGCGP
ncbi:MAG: DUF4829 domain-containing protein [Actinobacteria bacterium]|nr:DUF4829 domain-containing protein [Actinomycetota bacterium]